MLTESSKIIKGIIATAIGYTAFSIGDTVIKYAGKDYDAIQTIFYVTVFMFILIILTSKSFGGLRTVARTTHLKRHITRGCVFTIAFLLFAHALQNIAFAKAYILLLTMPFISTAMAIPLLKEHVGWRRWLIITGGFIGALIVLRPGTISFDMATAGVILSAVFFSLYDIQTRTIGETEPKIVFLFFPALTIILMLGATLFIQGRLHLPELNMLPLFAFAAIGHLFGHFFTIKGYTLTPIAIAAPFQYIQLLWAFIFGYFLFQDSPDIWTITGGAIIVTCGLILIRREVKTNQ